MRAGVSSKTGVVALSVAAVIGASVVAAADWSKGASRSRNTTSSLRVAAPTGPRATTATVPSYLPPGATIAASRSFQAQTTASATLPAHSATGISLAGAANQNTITPSSGADPTGGTHPATVIDIGFVAGQRSLPPGPPAGDPDLVTATAVIGGNDARLLYTRSGIGLIKFQWIDADGYHEVMCDRLRTPDGLSGVDKAELLNIAQSLYSS
jgi:hypothetical protein